MCLNITPAISSHLHIVSFDRKRRDLSVCQFQNLVASYSSLSFLIIENVELLHSGFEFILDYGLQQFMDSLFLIDKKSPQHWPMTFQLNGALRLLQLLFSEKQWPSTFHLLARLAESALKRTPNQFELSFAIFSGIPLDKYV